MDKSPLLSIASLSLGFGKKKAASEVLKNVSLELYKNEILGLVGESGSGKSVTSLAVMGLLPAKTTIISNGEILFDGKNLLKASHQELSNIRGNKIAMIFQEPMSALNPSMKCGHQVAEVLMLHKKVSASRAKNQVISLFEQVKLPRPKELYKSYPHELSGGQLQRVMIAMAIACKPKLLIADEPTTALDVTVQREIIELLKELQKDTGMSILFISHDLTLVSELAHRVAVLYKGQLIEQGETAAIFKNPTHEYTRALLAARPSLNIRVKRLATVKDLLEGTYSEQEITQNTRSLNHKKLYTKAPLLRINNLHKTYWKSGGLFGKKQAVHAVNGVSFSVFEGETLGLVGESGCGKSTLGKTIMNIELATQGEILYKGKDLTKLNKAQTASMHKEIQIIFQDPFASLHPRMTIGQAISEPIAVHHPSSNKAKRKQKVLTLLEQVGLEASYFYRYPHELSGGQRQRVGIARAIALQPKLLICDESVSALDISVQAQVLNLLNDLKDQYNFTYIFISHDLAVVKYMADQLVVMNSGRIEEAGDADEIYANPRKEYTQALIEAIPKGIENQ
ncbi:MAG: ABC transporter ATP-binding protein [Gilvibacter sp.]